jgi:hypothetical protein
LSSEDGGKHEIVLEERNGQQVDRISLMQEEEASFPLLEPLFAWHLDFILETL